MGKIIIENAKMRLGDGNAFPRYPSNKSQKQRVDDYYGNKAVPGAPQVLMLQYNPPPSIVTQFYNEMMDNLNAVYDSRSDEIRTLQVQRIISDNNQTVVAPYSHPMASYQQAQYQPVQPQGQYRPPVSQGPTYGNVQMYNPQGAEFPPIPPAPPVTSNSAMFGGLNVEQFVQVAQLVDGLKGLNLGGMPTQQSQFVQTRSGSNAGPSTNQTGSPN